MRDAAVRRHTTASCFATCLLPYVLFVADPEERERVARVCNLAWNIALFPSAAERERQVAATADLIARDAEGGAETGPPPGFREGFADELAMLAELKRDLFPWQPGLITRVDLKPAPGRGTVDVLSVETGEGVESVELVLNPSIMGLPRITKALVEMHQNTRAQRGTLERAQNTPGLLERAVTRDMLSAYCAQRADLRGYHRMLAEWRDEVSYNPELKAGIERFLVADEIEDDTKAVLGILATALGAPLQERQK